MYRKLFSIFLLGFSSGMPLALCGGTLQMWFASEGIDIVTIATLTLVGQPYAYKFLWAPIMDRFTPPILGHRRGWMLICQLSLLGLLICLALLNPTQHAVLMGILALLVAFFSASQDIAIDAYRVDILAPEERGLGAAFGVEAYRLAMLVSGSVALIVADHIGWQATYLIMSGLMGVGIIATFIGIEPNVQLKRPETLAKAVILPFTEFFKRDKAVWILVFILLYKLGDAFTGSSGSSLTAIFMHNILGMSLSEIGYINKIIGLTASIIGVFLGGLLMTRIKLFNALFLFGCLQACSNALFMVLAIVGKYLWLTIGAVFIENLCAGMGTAALVAFFMSLCNQQFSAAQYALLSSFMVFGRVYLTPFAGLYIQQLGWFEFYFATVLITIPSLLLLLWLRKSIDSDQQFSHDDEDYSAQITNHNPIKENS